MSYSFQLRAASKAAAKAAVRSQFDIIAAQQVCHQRDRAQAEATADAFVDVLADKDGKEIQINMSGSLTGQWSGSDVVDVTGANVNVSAYLVDPLPQA